MSWRDVPKPPQIAALPVDPKTGYPIFFLMQPPPGRRLDFKLYNPLHKEQCGINRLCMVCGRGLGYWVWFAGSLDDITDRLCGDPPLHWDCADYSVQVCPFLLSAKLEFATARGSLPDQPFVAAGRDQSTPRPEEIVLGKTRAWYLVREGRRLMFRPRPFVHLHVKACDGLPLGPEPPDESWEAYAARVEGWKQATQHEA